MGGEKVEAMKLSNDQVTELMASADPYVRLMASELMAHRIDEPATCAEVALLREENQYIRMRFKESDLLFGKMILAMRAAIIESEHGKGAEAGIEWLIDALEGPGELPPANETDARVYFERELVSIDAEMDVCFDYFQARQKKIIAAQQAQGEKA
ncbi:hypothetical protein C3D67_18495 [Cronobacter sakazakii]|nr:hypothetical protein C3D67_18495 [Cronobacter sakazakii]